MTVIPAKLGNCESCQVECLLLDGSSNCVPCDRPKKDDQMPEEHGGPYYTLVINQDGKWSIEFGDYDQKVVQEERDDLVMFGEVTSDQCHIIKTETDLQSEIDRAVEDLQDWLDAK